MGEFIELIGQLKPKNNGNFPIADVNDLKGRHIQLDTVTQLNEHTALNTVTGYLTGVNKYSILNADLLEPRLIPLGWN